MYVFLSEFLNFYREGNEDTSLFIKFLKFLIYLFLAVLCLCCCEGFSLNLESEGYSPVAVCRLFIAVASLVAEYSL